MEARQCHHRIPDDAYRQAVRDLGVYTSSVLGEAVQRRIQDVFGTPYTFQLWLVRHNRQLEIYFSAREHKAFHETMGELGRNLEWCRDVAKKVHAYTDQLRRLMKDITRETFKRRRDEFAATLRELFVYHQAACYAGDKLFGKEGREQHAALLDEAHKYDEAVFGEAEDFLERMGAQHLLHDEEQAEEEDRTLLFTKNERIILNAEETKQIQEWLHRNVLAKASEEVRGTSITSGKVTGTVCLITDPNAFHTVEPGTILVTTQTRPQFNHLIATCAGIVTNEGGMLCHAGIIAREHNIPCIVGTKNATNSFNNGDQITLDADKGVVTKVKP
jgi:phosphoenolpyruvate synthase/pyruvate phosphate dikinase